IVEEPIQVALGFGFDQLLQIVRSFVFIWAVGRKGSSQGGVTDHVPQHPPDEHRLTAIELVIGSMNKRVIACGILLRDFLGIGECGAVNSEVIESSLSAGGVLAPERLGKMRDAFVDPWAWRSKHGV